MMTATAALITAVGGIFALLLQAGVIGGSNKTAFPSPNAAARTSRTATEAVSGTTPKAGSAKPWSEVQAIITPNAGAVTKVRAETLTYCIGSSPSVELSSGQDVPFEQMSSLEVLRSDDQFTSNGKADLRIRLVSGETLRGSMGSGCDFIGHNDLGRFSIYPQDLKRIDFRR